MLEPRRAFLQLKVHLFSASVGSRMLWALKKESSVSNISVKSEEEEEEGQKSKLFAAPIVLGCVPGVVPRTRTRHARSIFPVSSDDCARSTADYQRGQRCSWHVHTTTVYDAPALFVLDRGNKRKVEDDVSSVPQLGALPQVQESKRVRRCARLLAESRCRSSGHSKGKGRADTHPRLRDTSRPLARETRFASLCIGRSRRLQGSRAHVCQQCLLPHATDSKMCLAKEPTRQAVGPRRLQQVLQLSVFHLSWRGFGVGTGSHATVSSVINLSAVCRLSPRCSISPELRECFFGTTRHHLTTPSPRLELVRICWKLLTQMRLQRWQWTSQECECLSVEKHGNLL